MYGNTENTTVRDKRRNERIGDGSVCVACGVSDKRVLEVHHVAGRRNDNDAAVIVCRNHHAIVTEELRVSDVKMTAPANPLHCLSAVIGGIAEMFRVLTATLTGWADWIRRFADMMDHEFPGWETHASRLPSPSTMRGAA